MSVGEVDHALASIGGGDDSLLVEGVDLMGWPGGLVSATHGEAEMELTVEAFARALAMLKREGDL